MLVIYLVDPNFTNHISNDEVLVGLAIGIPQLKEPKGLQYTYKVNLRWAAEHFGVDEDEVDEIGEFDD